MSHFTSPIACEQFETNVSNYLDGTLSTSDRAAMEAHLSQCASCAMLRAEVGVIVAGAAALPALSPSRDLWAGIAERLDTPVVPIATTSGTFVVRRKPVMSFRMLAAAAMLIVAASSGVTYVLTRANSDEPVTVPMASAPAVPTIATPASALPQAVPMTTGATVAAAPERAPSSAGASGERTRSRYASNDGAVEVVYEREITAMRRIVDERLGDLDSATVVEIERNLRIIDKAINDSRRALQNDPRSRFLSSQLDKALENKLGVLRRIALL